MHPLEQYFVGGQSEALADFGLLKAAAITDAQRQAILAQARARPKGLAAVQAAGSTPMPTGNVAKATTPGGWQPSPVGGPSADPRFAAGQQARALPLETPPAEALKNRVMSGHAVMSPQGSQVGSAAIGGQAARAELAAQGPMRNRLPAKLAQFLLH